MAGISVSRLPAEVTEVHGDKQVIRHLVMDDSTPGPYHEVWGARIRRTPYHVHVEWKTDDGDWCNYYVNLDPETRLRGSFVHMHQIMAVSRALALRAPGHPQP